MPIYQMSIFRMPKIERKCKGTSCGGDLEGKTHLVKWEVVCTDKNKGGLSLRKLALLNKALLGKWIWRYACNKDNLWKQVITTKYGQEGLGWRSKKANGAPKSDFGQIFGVLVQRCATASLTFLSWLFIGMQRLRKCGIKILVKEAFFRGRLSSLEGRKKWCIWVDRVPTKVAFLAWEATWGKVLTLDRL
ncbi:hypothetical protein CK203_055504 [Vitis vinifera]|uniref:Uncharacterized protein n=1 Tax=Vitis vinifera TaxID=29760 RepID=A0A438FKU6_VITVI|nr:hypothetical protein CK203_055504 [Vitis vinifera]